MIKFTLKFPFIRFDKQLSAEDYFETITLHTNVASEHNRELVIKCKDLLIENRIPLSKIRFVFDFSFIYDVDTGAINPSYKAMIPINKKYPVIEIGKPENTMHVCLGEHRTSDNYAYLKHIAHKSKKGVAILVDTNYNEVIWLANLDEAVAFYKENLSGLENNE